MRTSPSGSRLPGLSVKSASAVRRAAVQPTAASAPPTRRPRLVSVEVWKCGSVEEAASTGNDSALPLPLHDHQSFFIYISPGESTCRSGHVRPHFHTRVPSPPLVRGVGHTSTLALLPLKLRRGDYQRGGFGEQRAVGIARRFGQERLYLLRDFAAGFGFRVLCQNGL